jgi:quinol monooxygenase YgiN
MSIVRTVLIMSLFASQAAGGQAPDASAAGGAFAVAYVETQTAEAARGRAALERYRDSLQRQAGCLGIELFEQAGRPGHFAVLEHWRDAAALDARDAAAKGELMQALEPLRVSGYDERPYKPLALGPMESANARVTGMFVITHVDVAPNPDVPPLLSQHAAASRAERGNLRFDVVQHTMRGNHFTVVEHWASQAALDAHVAAAHTRAYRDALQPFTGSPLDERVYRALAPRDFQFGRDSAHER